VLPAAHETVDTWKSGFAFEDMPEDQVRMAKQQLRILVFPGTEVLWKTMEGVAEPEGHHTLHPEPPEEDLREARIIVMELVASVVDSASAETKQVTAVADCVKTETEQVTGIGVGLEEQIIKISGVAAGPAQMAIESVPGPRQETLVDMLMSEISEIKIQPPAVATAVEEKVMEEPANGGAGAGASEAGVIGVITTEAVVASASGPSFK